MTDTIYSNEKPLDLMDPALRKELEAHERAGGKVEVYSSVVGWNSVAPVWCRSSFGGCVYRAVKEPEVTTVWQNVYPRHIGVTFGGGYSSRDEADRQRGTDRIAVIRTETIDGVSKAYLEDV